MGPERDDAARYGVTQDADPAMLVGALGDERDGLDLERDAQQADDELDPAGEQGRPTWRGPTRGKPLGDFAAPPVAEDADPAMLVGALGDERDGLDLERDAQQADEHDSASPET